MRSSDEVSWVLQAGSNTAPHGRVSGRRGALDRTTGHIGAGMGTNRPPVGLNRERLSKEPSRRIAASIGSASVPHRHGDRSDPGPRRCLASLSLQAEDIADALHYAAEALRERELPIRRPA